MRNVVIVVLLLGLAVGAVGCKGAVAGRGAPGKVVYRVNCGDSKEYADQGGAKWMPDQEYAAGAKYGAIGGKVVVREALKTVAGTRAPEVYRTERYGMSGYRFDVPDGKYAVALHFCETYERLTQSGERVFSVKIQGKPVLADFDVLKEAGGPARPVVKEFKNIEVTDGRLSIEFVPKIQNPEINGIEVFAQ